MIIKKDFASRALQGMERFCPGHVYLKINMPFAAGSSSWNPYV
jgi:hypothetical protein